jgi:hypothetical protein
MEVLSLTEIQEGDKRWVLEAQHADFNKDQLQVSLSGVKVEFFGPGEHVKVKADEVAKLVVRVSKLVANTTDNRDMPDICMQYLCAVMLIDGIVTFKSAHDEKSMQDRKVLDMRSRIELMRSASRGPTTTRRVAASSRTT